MINITDKSHCSGCTACAMVCPHNAISMQPDVLGFLYPAVDKNKCIDCGLCEKACVFTVGYSKGNNLDIPLVYAARHKDMQEVASSQSGALFTALAGWFIENNGVVYGAGYTDNIRVAHKRAITKQECNALKGSKYVQSDMHAIFLQAKRDLENGLKVLFSGTPCQTAGLKNFLQVLNADSTNIYLCDLICHGVPGPYCWRDYITYLENKYKRKIIKANFRDKSFGWSSHQESFTFDNTYTYTYTYLFYTHIMLRRSCGVCPFTNFRRPSDITIGDFWEFSKEPKEKRIYNTFHADNMGISLVLINTAKGVQLFNDIKDRLHYIESDTIECLQPQLQHPAVIPNTRDEFERDYQNHDYAYIIKKYGDNSLRAKLKHKKALLFRNLKKFKMLRKIKKMLYGVIK